MTVARQISVLMLLLVLCSVANAEEHVTICATYVSTGKNYKVDAIQATGNELNTATHSMSYDVFAHYIVIFWTQGEATIINVGYLPVSLVVGASGKDQEGRDWRVSVATVLCT
jgi:hypothetical protein